MHARMRVVALVGLLTVLTSCESLLGPDARPTMYVLRSIDGSALPVNLDSFFDNGTSGGEWTVLADTLVFFAGGRGEWRGSTRFYAPIGLRGSPDPGPRIDTHRQTFRYEGEGRTVTLYHDRCEELGCISDVMRPESIDLGRLRRSIIREWVYERVRE